jgi:glycerate kinase
MHLPLKILVAPNAFKGSLTAADAASAIREGILAVLPDAEIIELPVADGGDGTADVLIRGTTGKIIYQPDILDPLGRPRTATFGMMGDAKTAVIEMASASGLTLVPPEQRNPMFATSYGTGQLIKACLDYGCTKIIVGVGGSATVDGGAGMAQALGIRLVTKSGESIRPGAQDLGSLAKIDTNHLDSRLSAVEIMVACDVDNPLVGPNGAARVFGPQKGADPEMVDQLEQSLTHFAYIIERTLDKQVATIPYGGAAGGLSAGLYAFLNAQLVSGIDLILDLLNFDAIVQTVDLVITGEGCIDAQTVHGKAPIGVAIAAKKYGIPVIGLAGIISDNAHIVYDHGIDALVPITPYPITLDEAMQNARTLLRNATERTMHLLMVGKRLKD